VAKEVEEATEEVMEEEAMVEVVEEDTEEEDMDTEKEALLMKKHLMRKVN
jgi:hypothetical protein